MAGPIAKAFVEIIAKVKLDSNNELEEGIRSTVRTAQARLDGLEASATQAGRKIAAALRNIDITLDTRGAIRNLEQVGRATESTITELKRLSGIAVEIEPDFNSLEFNRGVGRLQASLTKLANTFNAVDGKTLTFDAGKANAAIGSVQKQLQQVADQMNRLESDNFEFDFGQAFEQITRLTQKLGDLSQDLTRIGDRQVRVNIADMQLDELQANLNEATASLGRLDDKPITLRTQQAQQQVRAVDEEVERVIHDLNLLENHGVDVGNQLRGLAVRAGAFFVAREAITGLRTLITLGVQAAAEIERTEVGLRQLFQGLDEAGRSLGTTAGEFLGQLRELAITTPFEFADLGDTSRRLVTLGGDADTVIQRMRDLADAAASFGGTSEDIDGVVRAITQLASKGKVDLQDFRQISERLPSFTRILQVQGIIDELNELHPELGATAADFNDLRESGALTTDVIVNGLFRGLRQIPGAAGAAAAQARTLSGALSNLKDFATIEFADSFKGVGEVLSGELLTAFESVESGDLGTGLASSIKTVIQAAGDAAEDSLGDVFGFVQDISDEIVDALAAAGDLVGSLASGFGGNALEGAVDALTSITTLLTLANDVLSLLPDGAARAVSQFVTLAAVIPGVSTPFKKLATDVLNIAINAEGSAAALENLGSTVAKAGAVGLGLVALQVTLNAIATQARRIREFEQAIDDATDSLKEFGDTGEAVLDFLGKFEEAGAGINIGQLEGAFDGLTSIDLAGDLGVSQDKLGVLVNSLASLPDDAFDVLSVGVEQFVQDLNDANRGSGSLATGLDADGQALANAASHMEALSGAADVLGGALGEAGIPLSILDNISGDTAASLIKLVEAWREGAEVQLRFSVLNGEFAHVAQGTVDAILAEAEATGDFITATDALERAESNAMRGTFNRLAAQENLTAAERTALLTQTALEDGTYDFAAATAQLQEEVAGLDQSFEDLLSDQPRLRAAVAAMSDGIGTAASDFLDLALAADAAGLTTEELSGLARGLGLALDGEELGAELEAIVKDFDDTFDSLLESLPAFEDAFGNVMDAIAIPEDVGEGFDELQFKLDHFSTRAFIEELGKITEAQVDLLDNLQTIAEIDPTAVTRLLDIGLDPAELALVAEDLANGGQGLIDRFLEPFATSDFAIATTGANIVRLLVESGIDPELLAQSPALAGSVQAFFEQAFGDGATAATEAVNQSAAQIVGDALDAIGVLTQPGAGTPEVAEGDTAGAEAAAAVNEAFASGLDIQNALSVEVGELVTTVFQLGSVLDTVGKTMGARVTAAFSQGLQLRTAATIQLFSATTALLSDRLMPVAGFALGLRVGAAFGNGVLSGITLMTDAIRDAVSDLFGVQFPQPAAPIPGSPGFPKVPRFAEGFFLNKATLGVVAEDGPEVGIPLSNRSRALELSDMSGLTEMILAARGGGGGTHVAPGAVQIVTTAGGREVFDEFDARLGWALSSRGDGATS